MMYHDFIDTKMTPVIRFHGFGDGETFPHGLAVKHR